MKKPSVDRFLCAGERKGEIPWEKGWGKCPLPSIWNGKKGEGPRTHVCIHGKKRSSKKKDIDLSENGRIKETSKKKPIDFRPKKGGKRGAQGEKQSSPARGHGQKTHNRPVSPRRHQESRREKVVLKLKKKNHL